MPTVHEATFRDNYRRYIGPLASELPATLGMNTSTHVAEVCLDPDEPKKSERAVVKYFRFTDQGWANEYVAWLLACELGVVTPPRASLLIGNHDEITEGHGEELKTVARFDSGPMVLWCTSAVEPTRPVQQVFAKPWERVALGVESGRRMAAFDGWTGNCDRLHQNTLYWTTGHTLVAIDHEKIAFNQDWTTAPLQHFDMMLDAAGEPKIRTRLLDALTRALSSSDNAVKKKAKEAKSAMFEHSKVSHPAALKLCSGLISRLLDSNFSNESSENLLSFLEHRLSDECMKSRYGYAI